MGRRGKERDNRSISTYYLFVFSHALMFGRKRKKIREGVKGKGRLGKGWERRGKSGKGR